MGPLTLTQLLNRLHRRGTVVIRTTDDGVSLSWVVTGQRGNPFAPSWYGEGPDLYALAEQAFEATTPPWRSIDSAAYLRQQERLRNARRIAERMVVR